MNIYNVCHLVGNGASYKKFYECEKTKDEFVLGCNLSPIKTIDASIFVDIRFIRLIAIGELQFDKPMIVNEKAKQNYSKKLNNVLEYFDKKQLIKNNKVLSSGHYGACWLAEKGAKTIHIWGCDVLGGVNSLNSYTDKYYQSACKKDKSHITRFSQNWREGWQTIFKKYPHIKFIKHV
jgi:hypothetical protein